MFNNSSKMNKFALKNVNNTKFDIYLFEENDHICEAVRYEVVTAKCPIPIYFQPGPHSPLNSPGESGA